MTQPVRLRRALEEALRDDPDDLATHSAYADLLSESDDPRGEFIQVQLVLENPDRPGHARRQLRQREKQLLREHEADWLGELAPLLLGKPEQQRAMFAEEVRADHLRYLDYATEKMHFRHGWSRGWLDRFECDNISVEMVRKLGRAPLARLIRSLVFRGDRSAGLYQYESSEDLPDVAPYDFHPCEVLGHYPVLSNVRTFQYGEEVDPEEDHYWAGSQYDRLAPLVGKMPRLEELSVFAHIYRKEEQRADWSRIFSLPTLGNLRVLRSYHSHVYPLEVLTENSALSRLTHLLCFPHTGAGEYDLETRSYTETAINRTNVRTVVNSKHLKSLTHLQLRNCGGGDDMVLDIIRSGIMKRLKVLDLRHGVITDKGAERFARHRHTKGLELLDLTNNRLTNAGMSALQSAGVNVRADRHQRRPYREYDYLYHGDTE